MAAEFHLCERPALMKCTCCTIIILERNALQKNRMNYTLRPRTRVRELYNSCCFLLSSLFRRRSISRRIRCRRRVRPVIYSRLEIVVETVARAQYIIVAATSATRRQGQQCTR